MQLLQETLVDETKEEMAYFWQPKKEEYEYTRPVAKRGTLWGDLVVADIKLIWYVRRSMDSMGFGMVLQQCIHNNPMRDISLLTWCAAVLGWYEYDFKMFWLVVVNFFVVGCVRPFIAAPRPFEFDRRLRPMADRQPSCYGFPSIESHMAVCVYGYIGYRLGHPVFYLATGAWCILVGLTRIYAGSRFIHQVLLSLLSGACSLWLFIHRWQDVIPNWGEAPRLKKFRVAEVFVIGIVWFAFVCLAVENNSSWLAGVPAREYVRVMTDIMDVGAAASQRQGAAAYPGSDGAFDNMGKRGGRSAAKQAANENDEEEEEEEDLHPLLRDPLLKKLDALQHKGLSKIERRRRAAAKRKDSFYFLQHAMRRKDMERIEVQTARALEDEEEADDLFAEEDASGGDDDAEEEEEELLRSGGGGGGGRLLRRKARRDRVNRETGFRKKQGGVNRNV